MDEEFLEGLLAGELYIQEAEAFVGKLFKGLFALHLEPDFVWDLVLDNRLFLTVLKRRFLGR